MKKIVLFSVILFSFLVHANAQTTNKKEAKKWFKKKEWLGDVPLQPSKSIDAQEFYRQYQINKTYWDKAFAFLKAHDLRTLASGKYEIDGENVFASVTESPSKDFDKTNWESHRNYVDLQYVIDGKELIGVNPVAKSTVTHPYDEKKDAANYTADGKIYEATPGTFFIFFPTDAHRPNITPGGNKVVKKLVIKVRAAE
ncbi:MAG: YhcH/YjgK/YiaL family protein [Flavisolibacter sp.]|jgi:YhcH/YjgK/YiaL family protein